MDFLPSKFNSMAHQPKNSVLIIEDSKAIGLLLAEFLEKLNYHDIHKAENGSIGIAIFLELVNKNNEAPIVFLDYNLPDMNAFSVFSQILKVRPDVKVIIETVMEKDDKQIKQLISFGAYHYIQKPIRFEKLREVMDAFDAEEHLTQTNSNESGDQIMALIKSSSSISLERLVDYSKSKSEDVLSFLETQISEGKVQKLDDVKEVACPQCGAVKVTQSFFCPSCNSSNFKQGKAIEHFECGNISNADQYENDKCPKCRKEIKILGVDYRVMSNLYMCNECDNKFGELPFSYLCLQCSNKFKLEEAKWRVGPSFRSVK